MTHPTCPQCDCVAGCQARERLCPNFAEPDVTFIDEGNKAVAQPVQPILTSTSKPVAYQDPETQLTITATLKSLNKSKHARYSIPLSLTDFQALKVKSPQSPQPMQQIGIDSPESFERMFNAACADLGLINEALGLDPDDGGAEPILEAISELKATIAQPAPEHELVYQYQMANGAWFDQNRESYDYNVKMGRAVVRVLYKSIAQPVPPTIDFKCPVCNCPPVFFLDVRVNEWEGLCDNCGISGKSAATKAEAMRKWDVFANGY